MNISFKNINHQKIFNTSFILYYIIYTLSLIGFSFVAPKYLDTFIMIVKIYISFLLIWKFNPLKKQIVVYKY